MVTKTPWRNGYLIVEEKVDDLYLKSRNIEVNVKPRTITVKGAHDYSMYRGVVENVLYLSLRENVQPFIDEEFRGGAHVCSRLFKVRYIKTFYGEYYSITPPEYFYVNYLVLTDSEVAVSIPMKRNVFVEKINDKYIVYIY